MSGPSGAGSHAVAGSSRHERHHVRHLGARAPSRRLSWRPPAAPPPGRGHLPRLGHVGRQRRRPHYLRAVQGRPAPNRGWSPRPVRTPPASLRSTAGQAAAPVPRARLSCRANVV